MDARSSTVGSGRRDAVNVRETPPSDQPRASEVPILSGKVRRRELRDRLGSAVLLALNVAASLLVLRRCLWNGIEGLGFFLLIAMPWIACGIVTWRPKSMVAWRFSSGLAVLLTIAWLQHVTLGVFELPEPRPSGGASSTGGMGASTLAGMALLVAGITHFALPLLYNRILRG